MQAVRRILQGLTETFRKQKTSAKVAIAAAALLGMCCLCSLPFALLSPGDGAAPTGAGGAAAPVDAAPAQASQPEQQARSAQPTRTARPTSTPRPTDTPQPTQTPPPPTETPDPNLLLPGTYIVGADIRPGFYTGSTGTDGLLDSCYWARLKDLSGSFDALIANDNANGLYYIEVLESDYALNSACPLRYLPALPAPASPFPQTIDPGTYLVGIDIQPGTYRGQAGADFSGSCYWARLNNVRGSLDALLANDNAVGQFYVQVSAGDFALQTRCELERVGD